MISYPFVSENITPDAPYGDRPITDEDERAFNRLKYTNGVFIPSGEVKATYSGLRVMASGDGVSVKVYPGGCCIEGAIGYTTDVTELSLAAPDSTNDRIDRVVARLDLSDAVRSIDLYVKTGEPGKYPMAPSLTLSENVYEIALADVRVKAGVVILSQAEITDQRWNISLCGQVLPAMAGAGQIKSEALSEAQSAYSEAKSFLQSAIDDSLAGQLNAEILTLKDGGLNEAADLKVNGGQIMLRTGKFGLVNNPWYYRVLKVVFKDGKQVSPDLPCLAPLNLDEVKVWTSQIENGYLIGPQDQTQDESKTYNWSFTRSNINQYNFKLTGLKAGGDMPDGTYYIHLAYKASAPEEHTTSLKDFPQCGLIVFNQLYYPNILLPMIVVGSDPICGSYIESTTM